MTNDDIKHLKFDILVKNICKKSDIYYCYLTKRSHEYNNFKKFSDIYGEITPLFIFFDTKSGNYYRKSIFLNEDTITRISDCGYEGDIFFKQTFSNDITKKIYLAKALIKTCGSDGAKYFIFWALLAAHVDKTDYDEKISMIVDFAHMANIDEDDLFDIVQVIKVVFGEKPENIKFKVEYLYGSYIFKDVLSLF